jgi:hypothetical protein
MLITPLRLPPFQQAGAARFSVGDDYKLMVRSGSNTGAGLARHQFLALLFEAALVIRRAAEGPPPSLSDILWEVVRRARWVKRGGTGGLGERGRYGDLCYVYEPLGHLAGQVGWLGRYGERRGGRW